MKKDIKDNTDISTNKFFYNKKKIIAVIAVMAVAICGASFMYINKKSNAEAETVNIEQTLNLKITDDINIELVYIPSGEFEMGSAEGVGDEDELPVRNVSITDGFYMGIYEITNEQWNAIMGTEPSTYNGENLPVQNVSYTDSLTFCDKLSELTGFDVSLPTEAQWEYACRAGSTTKWFWGDDENDYSLYANDSASDGPYAVGGYLPNQFGLYDMYGNVMEWCLDYYAAEYDSSDTVDPFNDTESVSRVVRGGGWGEIPDYSRSAYRNAVGEDSATDGIGFRIVVNTNNN